MNQKTRKKNSIQKNTHSLITQKNDEFPSKKYMRIALLDDFLMKNDNKK